MPEYDLEGLVKDMMVSDLRLVQKGHEIYRQSE